jgi:glycine cleavage system regulatory protein
VVRSVTVSALTPQPTGQLYLVQVSGADRTGIIHHTAQLLAERNIGITDLQANRLTGGEGPVYMLLLECWIPAPEAMLPGLTHALAELGQRLGVDARITYCKPYGRYAGVAVP